MERTDWLKDEHGTDRERAGVCLIPACRYTQAGLERLAQAQGQAVYVLDREADVMLVPPLPFRQVICHFSGDLACHISQVALLGNYLLTHASTTPVTLLTRKAMPWLYATLLHLTGRTASLQAICTLDARCPVDVLAALMEGARPATVRPLKGRESYTLASGLTRRELTVVRAVLGGERIRDMAQRTGLSVSVLHAQRHHGLRKLGLGTGTRWTKGE